MSYRDPVEAARARRDALGAALSRLDEDDPRRASLESELAAVHETIEASRRKLALRVLSDVRIATPCPASWGAMAGDDRVRRCALCEKNVYDLAGLTAWESVHLLASHGEEACVRLHRRRDGSVITADCEVGRRRRRKGAAVMAAGGALVLATATMAALHDPVATAMPRPAVLGESVQLDEAAFFDLDPRPPPPTPDELHAMMGGPQSVELLLEGSRPMPSSARPSGMGSEPPVSP